MLTYNLYYNSDANIEPEITQYNNIMPQILIVEDDKNMSALFEEFLKDEPWTITKVMDGTNALDALNNASFDAVLLDLKLPDMDGFDILKHIKEKGMGSAVIVITGQGSMNTAIEAMRLGAKDFLVKPTDKERLVITLKNALENQELKQTVETYKKKIDRRDYCGFIGSSLAMQEVYRIIDSAANSKATVFITGESGTGKEICAEAIHKKSDRKGKPFCAINCAAIPRDLMESEIFGHVKGAFTGANADRDGAASRADGGTLFLDEIGEMDLDLQTKLLRFVQTGKFMKVGGSKEISVDARIICATNRDPLVEVQAGRFREDLYYRLHVVPIDMPPLRARGDDILQIAEFFLKTHTDEEKKSFKGFDNDVRSIFMAYEWPGNVRQLQNVVRNIVVLNDAEDVSVNLLPAPLNDIDPASAPAVSPTQTVTEAPPPVIVRQSVPQQASPESLLGDTAETLVRMDALECMAIENALKVCEVNVPEAAHYLGVSAATIYRKKAAWEKEGQAHSA